MKRFIITIAMILGIGAMQIQAQTYSITADTVKGNETVNFDLRKITGSYDLVLSGLFTQKGGTTDGTVNLLGSVDGTNYVGIFDCAGVIAGFPNDTATMVNGGKWQILVKGTPWTYYRAQVAGTASDTTIVNFTYTLKKRD